MTRFPSILRSTDRQLVRFSFVLLAFAAAAAAAEDDLYDVLGVDKSASTHEIRNAYKSLAKEWHPDKNSDPAANEKFMKINEAYETLSNDERRSQYDNHGTTSAQVGQEHHRSDNEFAGASFNFGGFTFTFSGKTFDHFGQKYRLTLRSYEDVVLPGSQKKPYVVFIYSDYCDDCSQIEDTWEMLLQDLVKSDVGIGTINFESEKSLVKKLRISQSPSVFGIIEGQLRWFSGSFELQSLRDFTRRLFPSDLIQEVNNATNDVFLNSWKIDNRVHLLFFDLRKAPPLRLVAAAFAYRRFVTVGYVNMARLECDYLITNYQLDRNQENLLIFKEDTLNPIIKTTAPEIKRPDINEAIERNQFLILPRISSPMMFYDYCLPVSPLTSRKLCVILLTKKIPQHDVYRESFREYASRHAQERVKFGYVYEETQSPLVRLMTWGNGAVNDTHGTLKVAILWHKEPKTVHYDMLENGWHSSGSELQRSRRKLKQVIDWLLQTGDVMPYTMKLRSEIIDEHAQNIWIRVVMRLHSWIYRLWDKVLSIDEILLLTVVTTAILVVVIGVVVRVLVMTEDANVQRKMAPKEKEEKIASLNLQQPVASSRPTVHIYPLCCENYDELVLQGGNEIQLVVILVDEASRAKLLQYFAWILLPYLKSKPYKVAFLQLEEYLPWYRSLLEATMGLLDSSEEAKRNLSHINMKNCLGTVLAINSGKKFYYMYHYSTTKPSSSDYLDDDLSSDECAQALRSDAKKLFESDLVRGFGQWMERLVGGKLKKYRVVFWPDMVA